MSVAAVTAGGGGQAQVGIKGDHIGQHEGAFDGDLVQGRGVGDKGADAYLGPGASGGGNQGKGVQAGGDAVWANHFGKGHAAAQDGDQFGHIHHRPAAKADDQVRVHGAGGRNGGGQVYGVGFGLHIRDHHHLPGQGQTVQHGG